METNRSATYYLGNHLEHPTKTLGTSHCTQHQHNKTQKPSGTPGYPYITITNHIRTVKTIQNIWDG